jgi:hypothetical protein
VQNIAVMEYMRGSYEIAVGKAEGGRTLLK